MPVLRSLIPILSVLSYCFAYPVEWNHFKRTQKPIAVYAVYISMFQTKSEQNRLSRCLNADQNSTHLCWLFRLLSITKTRSGNTFLKHGGVGVFQSLRIHFFFVLFCFFMSVAQILLPELSGCISSSNLQEGLRSHLWCCWMILSYTVRCFCYFGHLINISEGSRLNNRNVLLYNAEQVGFIEGHVVLDRL